MKTPPRRKGLTALDGLTTFLYLLMRDEVPAGTVAKLAHEVSRVRGSKKAVEFSSPELAALAARHAREIMHKKRSE